MFKPTIKKKSSIDIIPMIDVIFFILIFFMLFTTFRTSPTGIDLQLPRAVTVSEQKRENFVIDIDGNGNLYYKGEQISYDRLTSIARDIYAENNQVVAIINADRNVKYESIISAMDSLRQAGIYQLALAADKKE
ncbi:MAG TPA: biopolymer transporter ExbD [Halanaerobiaceae bacterium]|nr:biopolymer transporter ExbD [Halanaerobiaceae bacterium]HOA41024.1 biopolymer transporter ExbD [Halanaerobiales bacterium]HPZ63292.1 biopolymer transporter ExbD [Halanaerobiales bacterium]HQD04543.1 biopolymer transporter ExbD [Halanaerobiales bacterium]